MPAVNAAAVGSRYARLGEAALERERKIKREMAAVSLLWLVGCPVLCSLPTTNAGSLYGTPDEMMCGFPQYSVSASMTGRYSKVLGSVMAPLFALLVVQRSVNGLCSTLKLGWLARFSPLIPGLAGRDEKQKKEVLNPSEEEKASPHAVALKLWSRIEQIEFLGYKAAFALIGLVAFDSKHFPGTHLLLATVAFWSLTQQNRLVGSLGRDFGDLFPDWTYGHGAKVFWWGMAHLFLMYFWVTVLSTVHHLGRCDDLMSVVNSFSVTVFGNPTIVRQLVSAAIWANEYAFAFMCIYVQLLEHYELRCWEFAGEGNFAYTAIVPRFSVSAAVERLFAGRSDAEVYLGISKASGDARGERGDKAKAA